MGIENNRDVEKTQEQNIEKNENKPENQEQLDNKLNDIENKLKPPTSEEPKGNNELQKEQEGLKKNEDRPDNDVEKVEKNKTEEEKPQAFEEKLNNIENSLQPKGIEGNEINIKEESNNIEKDLGAIEHKNSLEDNEKTFTNNEESGNIKEKQTKDEVSGEPESYKNNQVENVKYDESSRYDTPTSSDVNNELSKALEPFEQSKWESMDMDERKAAISELGDLIAIDLNLQNKPDIEYYNNSNEGDFGGYSSSENSIYINEHNMGDAAETADTIAHESRHCWQHERAENPQNDQDREFKENFDDYICPEDDYRGYKNQVVEADAREYAADVRDEIKSLDNESDSNTTSVNEEFQESYNDKNPEKGAVFDSTELSEPTDINSKVEVLPISDKALQKCEKAGVNEAKVAELREIPNGEKPNPSEYLDKQYIDNHLDKFRSEGCYKIISDRRGEPAGTIGEGQEGIFVLNGQELNDMLKEANGDPRKLEKALSMPENYLGDNPYIVRADNPQNLSMATGNEDNAWEDEWCPCGTTRGGMDEAVIDPLDKGDYSYKHCFNDDEWKK